MTIAHQLKQLDCFFMFRKTGRHRVTLNKVGTSWQDRGGLDTCQ